MHNITTKVARLVFTQSADQTLLTEGQKAALGLLEQEARTLRHIAYQRLGNVEDSKEVIQLMRNKIYLTPHLWTGDTEYLRNYLRQTAKHTAISVWRRSKRIRTCSQFDNLTGVSAETIRVSEEQALDHAAIELRLRRAFIAPHVAELPEMQALVFRMRCLGFPCEYIARELGTTVKNVERHCRLAVRNLQKMIQRRLSDARTSPL